MSIEEKSLYTLIFLEEIKSLLGIDDREDRLVKFCLITSTMTIEQHCKRKLLKKQFFEVVKFFEDFLPLREYPVRKISATF